MTDETRKRATPRSRRTPPRRSPGRTSPPRRRRSPPPSSRCPEPAEAPEAEAAPADDEAAKYLALAQRTQADFENYQQARRARGRPGGRPRDGEARQGAAARARPPRARPAGGRGARRAASCQGHPPDPGRAGRRARPRRHRAVLAQGRAVRPRRARGDGLQPVEGAEPGTVAEVYQQGYRINGVVLRPARVVVAA